MAPGACTMAWPLVACEHAAAIAAVGPPPAPVFSFDTAPLPLPQAAAGKNLHPGNFHLAHASCQGVLQPGSLGILMPPPGPAGVGGVATQQQQAVAMRRDGRGLELLALAGGPDEEGSRPVSRAEDSAPHASFQHFAPNGTGCQLMQHGGQQQPGAVAMPAMPPFAAVAAATAAAAAAASSSPTALQSRQQVPQMALSNCPNPWAQAARPDSQEMHQRQPSVLEPGRGGNKEMDLTARQWELLLKSSMPDHYDD